ncbi:MAG: acyl-CoA dehydrogenase [Nitrospirae bacterium]|nr:acyl-CoA dehydrogenase [Nitrospirota bacterium]MBI3352435.1 acyl-CoA dehydrogenase [Nitrospirota bacterium]
MDFKLNSEQQMILEMVRQFVKKEVKPVAARMDREGTFPRGLVEKMSELGLMGAFMPPEHGGSGMDMISYVLVMEEISSAWAALSVIMTVNNSLVCEPIQRFGNEAQKRKYLSPLSKGDLLGCYALTEPGAGSDAGSLKTTAVKKGGLYLINGTKVFITSGKEADLAIVYALTAPEKGKKGISAFLVEKKFPGFKVGKLEDKLGLRSSDTAELLFENCEVPEENLLGVENDGFKIALATLDGGRIGIASQALGIARGCLDEAVVYSKTRQQFQQPLSSFQAIQWILADIKVGIDAARLMIFKAARNREKGLPMTLEAAMAKWFASEMANRAAYQALQVFGGYGYTKETNIERFYRDARITTLYEGTSEIQKVVIARELLR